MPNGITIDTREFSETLRRLLRETKQKTLPEVINKKGMIICARATKTTAKADWGKARGELMSNGLAYKIISKQRKDKGKPLPTKAEWPSVLESFLNARKRSIAFLRAGWIPALKEFAATIGRVSTARGLRAKYPIGGAKTAKPGIKVFAEFWNAAVGMHGDRISAEDALGRFAGPGLQEAIDKETEDMNRYIDREMQRTVDGFTSRILR